MKAVVTPSKVSGEVATPPSKSITHRAIILASLADGTSVIKNPLICEDTLLTIDALRALGVNINKKEEELVVVGSGGKLKAVRDIYVGNSGTTARMIASIAALAKGKVTIDGNKRMGERPMKDLLDALSQLGIKTNAKSQCLPIELTGGKLYGGDIKISGSTSSQYISSLLMASPFAKKDTKIKITDELVSKPYVDITIDAMRKFGVNVKRKGYQEFFIKNDQRYKPLHYFVEGDWSSASYFFSAAAICKSSVTVKGLNLRSTQGDKIFPSILQKMGCKIKKGKESITVTGSGLRGIEVDMSNYPDLVQSLAVVAAYAKGKTKIKDIGHLVGKETNRIEDTKEELQKMGIRVDTTKNSMTIYGGKPKGAEIDSHNDHRMAMAFTVAALGADRKTIINGAEYVSKSFPNFFDEIKKLGTKIETK